jgi:hypothetical protein
VGGARRACSSFTSTHTPDTRGQVPRPHTLTRLALGGTRATSNACGAHRHARQQPSSSARTCSGATPHSSNGSSNPRRCCRARSCRPRAVCQRRAQGGLAAHAAAARAAGGRGGGAGAAAAAAGGSTCKAAAAAAAGVGVVRVWTRGALPSRGRGCSGCICVGSPHSVVPPLIHTNTHHTTHTTQHTTHTPASIKAAAAAAAA